MNNRLLITSLLVGFIVLTANPTSADLDRENIWLLEYSTLQNCLKGLEHNVRKYTGKDYTIQKARISKDKPDEVVGWFNAVALKNRFICERKETGTKGTYWEGKIWLAERDKPS